MKILWISDCPDNKIHTGYATATRLIAIELMKRGHSFVFGSQGSQDANIEEISVGSSTCRSYGFGRGKFLSGQMIGEIDLLEKPDVIVTMADWQMVEGMMNLSGFEAFSKWICYAPVDGNMLSKHWDFMIYHIPYMVYMSPKYGASVCEPRRFGYADYVPLPVNLDNYALMPEVERAALRAECKTRIGWKPETKTVLTVARNQWRKNYPEIIKAAKLLKENFPGRFSFVLHCQPIEPMGWDLPALIKYYDVGDCVAISDQNINEELKNKLFNSADLFLLPSMGEGFGIPIAEAALYELPIFTTDDTAGKDLTDLMGCSSTNLAFETGWQNGPTIPRPCVSAATITNALVDYELRQLNAYDVQGTRRWAEELFNVKCVASKWENIMLDSMMARSRSFGREFSIGEGKLSV